MCGDRLTVLAFPTSHSSEEVQKTFATIEKADKLPELNHRWYPETVNSGLILFVS